MSAFVFLAVLFAALMHASWNALIRLRAEKVATMLLMSLCQAVIGIALIVTRDAPEAAVWLWLLASGALHAGYKMFLAFAYEVGDLSRVYPIARGAAPLFVLIASVLFLAEPLVPAGVVGILILASGILIMGHGSLMTDPGRRMLPLALASAVMTAGYSIVDGLGARAMGDAVAFVGWMFVIDAAFFTPAAIALRGPSVLSLAPRLWAVGAFAAGFSYLSYYIAVWAMTQAPIPLVTALRETSILFAVLIGWLAFGEKMDRAKWVSVGLILTGVVLMRL